MVIFTSSKTKKIKTTIIKTLYPNMYDIIIRLAHLIIKPYDNTAEIINYLTYLQDPKLIHKIINTPLKTDAGHISILIYATYMLKPIVVEKLLDLGADPHYKNEHNHDVIYYWCSIKPNTQEDHILLSIIAHTLLKYNVSK